MNLEIIKKINEIDLVLRKTLHDAPDKNGSRDKSIGFLGGISGLSLFYYLNYLRSANDENIVYVEQTLEIGFSILNSSKNKICINFTFYLTKKLINTVF